jgi:predicted lipoprotein with Yx(FWY)xxD motif
MSTRKIHDPVSGDKAEQTIRSRIRLRILLVLPAAAAAAVALAACGSPGTPSTASSPAGGSSPAAVAALSVKTAQIGNVTVLTNAQGFTLYAFSPDTSTMSKCVGTCAQIWPPVLGPVTAAGVTGTFGTIKRAGGTTQATFDGHPLYTYAGDTAPGQTKGNGIKGLWSEVTSSGSTPFAALSVKTAQIGSETVLTNAQGFTLYAFSPDTSTTSKCAGTCAQIWPPVLGPVTVAGVTGTFGTIKRADGTTQATFDGHPLYTYAGDTAPGQTKGNGIKGLWSEVTTPGSAVSAGSSSSGSGGGSN